MTISWVDEFLRPWAPSFVALAFPSGVRGPVARSHKRNSRISLDCRLRRSGVHPLHCLGLWLPKARPHSFITWLTHLNRTECSGPRILSTCFAVYSGCRLHIALMRIRSAVRLSSHQPTLLCTGLRLAAASRHSKLFTVLQIGHDKSESPVTITGIRIEAYFKCENARLTMLLRDGMDDGGVYCEHPVYRFLISWNARNETQWRHGRYRTRIARKVEGKPDEPTCWNEAGVRQAEPRALLKVTRSSRPRRRFARLRDIRAR
jgi:hypothetical protein